MSDLKERQYFSPSAFDELASYERKNWWFRSRNTVILWALGKHCNGFHRYLEVGCGTGFVLEAVRAQYEHAELYGSEYFEEGLLHARQRVPSASFRRLDATVMEDKECFDVIGAFDVIEHIEEDEKVLANLARAVVPGGALLITVPQHRWLWSAMDDYACHVRRYTRDELVLKVVRVGLEVEYVSSFVSLLLPLMWLSRLRAEKAVVDPMSEFKIPGWLNAGLEGVMNIERLLLRIGVCFPVGGSLLLVARKR